MSHVMGRQRCSHDGCENSFAPHKWGNMEAQRLGWFLQRNGDAWCPDHIPDWVAEWRKKKEEK